MKIYLITLLFILSGCINTPELPSPPKKKGLFGLFAGEPKAEQEPGEAPTPNEVMEKAYSSFIWIWGFSVLCGIIIIAGSLHPAMIHLHMGKVGIALIGLGVLGPVVVFIISTVVSAMIKLLIGLVVVCCVIAIGFVIWYACRRIKKHKSEHSDEVNEYRRKQRLLVEVTQKTKHLDWENEGKPLAIELLDGETELKDEIKWIKDQMV